MVTYLFEQELLSCIILEKELELPEGTVVSITIYAEGSIEIETKTLLSDIVQAKLKEALAKRGLPHGRKPTMLS